MAIVRVGHFEWDERKAASNVRKHGVTFEEAMSVFADDLSLPFRDLVHAERLVLVGASSVGRVLLVVFVERASGGILRIITARRATRHERRTYEEER